MNICRVATVPFFLHHHLREQVKATLDAGHQVTLVSSDGLEASQLKKITGVKYKQIEISRSISPWRDLIALWQLFFYFRKERFDIIHSVTPKAGFLCAIAGMFARTPIRLHTFTGQPWMELHGLLRFVAKTGDWLTAHLNTMIYADSYSQRNFLIEQNIVAEKRIKVIGRGSIAGVNLTRFNPNLYVSMSQNVLELLGIHQHTNIITFIGRVTKDKGVSELVEAFIQLNQNKFQCVLLLIGPQEAERDPLPDNVITSIVENPRIIEIGYTDCPEKYLAITDILCLPSYREGFGNVVIEAAAMGVPTIGTNIVGLRDAIVEDVTGLLVPVKNINSLVTALEKLLGNSKLRNDMGKKAMSRARGEFNSSFVNALMLTEYNGLAKRNLIDSTI